MARHCGIMLAGLAERIRMRDKQRVVDFRKFRH